MSENTVKLGLMPPLSGLVSIYGPEIARAGQIACQEINENGGVLGRPLELIIEDDGSLPESAVAAAEKLVDQHKCAAIIGNLLSNSRIAVAYRVAEPRKVPLLNFSFYEGSILSRYFFHYAALPNQQIDRMIPYMQQKYGPRMFFAGNNYEWPRGSIHAAKKVLLHCGGEVLGEEYCPIGVDTDTLEHLLDKVEASNADVFVPYFAGLDQINLLTRFTERGLKQRMAVVMGHYDEMMASQLPPEVREGFYSSNTYFMTVDTAENHNFLKRLANYPEVTGIWPNGNGILTNFGEGTYVCVKAFAEAANQAGSLESEVLVDTLKNLSLAAPQGTIQMNSTHHHARVNTYLSCCRANGEFSLIEKFGAIEPKLPERYNHQRITDQATMEDDIRMQARMLEQMSEAVLLISSQDNSIIYTNAGAERMFGYSKEEITGLPLAQLNHVSDNNPQISSINIIDSLNHKGEWQGEIQNIRKDGNSIWCSATFSTFTHPVHGEVWLAVYRDITANKEAEAALRESEARYKRAEQGTNDGLWEWNIETGYDYFSPRWLEMLGYQPDELPYHVDTFIDLIHPEDKASTANAIEQHLQNNQPFDIELQLRCKDGNYLWIRSRGQAIHDSQGKHHIMSGSIIDISERKQAETELAQHRHHLEELVEKRTTEMKIARDEAQRASAAKSEFLSRMSHELRTPLNAIIGFGQLLQTDPEQPLSERQTDSMQEIMHAGHHLLDLINEVLDLSRIESGRLDVSLEPVSIAPLLDACITQLQPLADQRQIKCTLALSTSCAVQADNMRLREVLLNLLSNAIKYNIEGGDVWVSCTPISEQTLRISMRDSGRGIAADMLSRLFKPFERLESSYNGIEGTGIGLALSKKLVEAMHGKIGVESVYGEGSTFWFELPIASMDSVNSITSATDTTTAQTTHPDPITRNAYTLLYVEDNPANLKLVQKIIDTRKNTDLLTAVNAEDGLDITMSQHPDLILLDINLPGMDGFEALRQLRANPATKDIPVIAITANAMNRDVKHGKTAGFDDYLTKPIDIAKFIDLLDRNLAGIHTGDENNNT